MAGGDYYSCDVCHGKTFYDSELDYQELDVDPWFFLPGVGEMKVICKKCAESHEVIVIRKVPTDTQQGDK